MRSSNPTCFQVFLGPPIANGQRHSSHPMRCMDLMESIAGSVLTGPTAGRTGRPYVLCSTRANGSEDSRRWRVRQQAGCVRLIRSTFSQLNAMTNILNDTTIAPHQSREAARFADPEAANAAVAAFDLQRLSPEFYANPYPTYHALRDLSPVHRLPDGSFFLSRYADCVSVYKDALIFSSDKQREFKPKFGDGLLYEHHTTSLVFNDPPLHTRVRKIIAGALTPRAIADMERPVTALVDGLLDAIAAKGGK